VSAGVRFLALALVLGVVLGVLVLGVRERLGIDRDPRTARQAECTVMPAPAGPEDLQIDARTGMAVISATDRRTPGARGDLWLLDAADPAARPVRLAREAPADFRPHGLGLVRVGETLHAWVVNHPEGTHTVEAFEIDLDAGVARHTATVRGEALVSPNDVVAVDAARFYVTNDHGTAGGIARLTEDALGLRLADVVHRGADGRLEPVIETLSYANGVALSRDGTELVVAEVLPGTVSFADREPVTGAVERFLLVELDTGADNVDVAPDGSVWVAGHPKLLDFLSHASDPEHPSPTEVWRIVRTNGSAEAELVWSDDGTTFSGGSVAAAWDDVLLVGGVFDPQLLRCTLPPELAPGRRPRRR
jgi:arylesterase/paraoxonase